MNIVDIIIAAILVVGFVIGVKKGLISMVVSLAAFVIAFWVSSAFYGNLLSFFPNSLQDKEFGPMVAYLILFVATIIISGLVAKILTKTLDFTPVGLVNRLIGGLIALIFTIAIVGIFSLFILKSDSLVDKYDELKNSKLLYLTRDATMYSYNYTLGLIKKSDLFNEKDKGTLEDKIKKLGKEYKKKIKHFKKDVEKKLNNKDK